MRHTRAVQKEIINFLRQTNREGIEDVIDWLCKTDFFVAPAATVHHSNFKGGLAYHSLSTYKVFCTFNDMAGANIPEESLIICGLLHDVCKIGVYHRVVGGYKREDTFPIGHGDKSIILLQQYIDLTEDEIYLMRWHMGPFDDAYKQYDRALEKVYRYARLLYLADSFSAFYLEDRK